MTVGHEQEYLPGTEDTGIVRRFLPVVCLRPSNPRLRRALTGTCDSSHADSRKPQRMHSKVHSLIPTSVITVLSALSLTSLTVAQNVDMQSSPIYPFIPNPPTLPSFVIFRAASNGPTEGNTAARTSQPSKSTSEIETPVPTKKPTLSPNPTDSSAPIQPTPVDSLPPQTVAPIVASTVAPSFSPTISAPPTLSLTSNPTFTPNPTKNPSSSPTDFPTASPSATPSQMATLEEASSATTTFLQSFKVGNGRVFNETEQFFFEETMKLYTKNISDDRDLSKINATCSMLDQTLLSVIGRRTFRQRLRSRFLQDGVSSSNASNQVEYHMDWKSSHYNVTEYPSLFSSFIESHLANVTADLREGGLDVLVSNSLRQVITTEAPSAAPSQYIAPSPRPTKKTPQPSLAPTLDAPTLMPSDETEEPSSMPVDKPVDQGSGGNASIVTNTAVIAIVFAFLAIVSFCGGILFYRRRKSIREMEFKAAAAAGRHSSEHDVRESNFDHSEVAGGDAEAPYEQGPNTSEDDYRVISPNESLLSNQSLISTGMPLAEGSIDEADKTHNLADAFDQYKDQNLEKVRADVEELVIGSDGMMNQAMTLAFMGDDEIFCDTRDLVAGAGGDSTEIEADLLCEVNDFLKRNEFADVEERKSFLQEITNKLVAYVLHGVIQADDASRTIHESAAMLGLELAVEIPENTVIVTGMRKNVTIAHMESAFREFGDLDEVAIASDARGFGLVRFLSPQSALRTMNAFREGEIVVQDVGVMVKVLKSEAIESAT